MVPKHPRRATELKEVKVQLKGYRLAQQGANLLLTNEANPANQILLKDFTSGDYGIVTGTDAVEAGDATMFPAWMTQLTHAKNAIVGCGNFC